MPADRGLTATLALAGCLVLRANCIAQEAPTAAEESSFKPRLRLHVEAKLNGRDSHGVEVPDHYPFPSEYVPPGYQVYLRTPQAGDSLELSNLALIADAELTPVIRARVRVHVLDLYERNPTSSDDRIFVREAWILLGHRYEPLQPMPGSSLFVLVGKAPRFSKQLDPHLESYGLWGTAVGRFEQLQVQVGGSVGRHFYFRVHLADANPLFFRDPNALAGDNGTPERQPGNIDPIYQSGFPILYDAKATDVNPTGKWETGGGLGARFGGKGEGAAALDVLAWAFHRELADRVRIRGSSYSGDLELLEGDGIPLPFSGRDKTEFGVNVHARLAGLRLFGQVVRQDIAHLRRQGYEAELAYFVPLPGLFASGDFPVINWVQPALRYSVIGDCWVTPAQFIAPSVGWDWKKLDVGARVGIIRGTDLTIEFARNDMRLKSGKVLHPDELLATLRFSF